MFTGKHLYWNLAALLKGDSNTDVFLWILRVFKNSFFYRVLLVAASERRSFLGNLQNFWSVLLLGAASEIGGNISWNLFIKMCYLYSINVLFINVLSKFYLRERNIYKGLFSFIYSCLFIFFKWLNWTSCITKRNHVWKYHLIFFFCNLMKDFFSFWRCSIIGAALPKEPHIRSKRLLIFKIAFQFF